MAKAGPALSRQLNEDVRLTKMDIARSEPLSQLTAPTTRATQEPARERGGSMMQSTRQLHEELAWLSAQLEAARDLEHAAEERHSDENMAETEVALEGRREEVRGLRKRRTRLVKELGRRAVAEKGWEPDRNLP